MSLRIRSASTVYVVHAMRAVCLLSESSPLVDLEHAREELIGLLKLFTPPVGVLAPGVRVHGPPKYGAQEGSEDSPLWGTQSQGIVAQARVLGHGVQQAAHSNLGRVETNESMT